MFKHSMLKSATAIRNPQSAIRKYPVAVFYSEKVAIPENNSYIY